MLHDAAAASHDVASGTGQGEGRSSLDWHYINMRCCVVIGTPTCRGGVHVVTPKADHYPTPIILMKCAYHRNIVGRGRSGEHGFCIWRGGLTHSDCIMAVFSSVAWENNIEHIDM